MAITNVIPTIWSARLIMALEQINVWSAVLNRNYEADARMGGDRVRIGTVTTDITVTDYTKNADLAAPQVLDDSTQDLLLNQQKAFHFYVDDIDRYQATPNLMDEAMRLSAVAISDEVDDFVKGVATAGRTVAANLVTDDAATIDAVTDGYLPAVRDLGVKMRRKNIARDRAKWLVVPPEFISNIEKYVADKGISGSLYAPATTEQVLRNGFRGMYAGFMLYESTNIETTGSGATEQYQCIAGTMDAGTFASQITEIEAYRPENRFGDAIKGLYVYGAKITKPDELFELRIAADTAS